MDETMRRAIVAEIAAATRVQTKQPWQFDVEDYLEQQPGFSRQQAYSQLMQLVRDGTLQSALVRHNGKQLRVFWRPQDVPESTT